MKRYKYEQIYDGPNDDFSFNKIVIKSLIRKRGPIKQINVKGKLCYFKVNLATVLYRYQNTFDRDFFSIYVTNNLLMYDTGTDNICNNSVLVNRINGIVWVRNWLKCENRSILVSLDQLLL